MTGGTNTGCMKLIGETVKQGQFLVPDGSKMRRGLKAIGLCSWGYIANSESLVNQTSTEFHKVVYNSNLEIKKFSKPPLDPNHTHFLMVDSGQNFQYMRVGFGGLTDFITEFERMVRSTTYIYIYVSIYLLYCVGAGARAARPRHPHHHAAAGGWHRRSL